MRGVDERALRDQNAQAPKVENLGRRVIALFVPYRGRIAVTAGLVIAGAAAGVIPPLIIQRVFDEALFPTSGVVQVPLLVWLVVTMIALYMLSSGVSALQTWFTSNVGNRVTGDLRVTMFEHLQSMELGFFTRTKTGVIQSRLQNDVGGVSGVLTTTVTSILGNTVTVIASLVAMILIDWRLTLISLVIMPPLVMVQNVVWGR